MEEKRLEMRSKGQISSDSTTAYPCLGSSSAAAAAGGGGGGLGDAGNEDDDDDLVFPGFRFHPTDEELVGFYLTRKVEKKAFSIEIIKEIDIYKHDPWDLPKASHGGGVLLLQGSSSSEKEKEKEWYFFCLRGRKYRNSIRPNRVTGSGFWKATGIDKPIYSAAAGGGGCIGLKKSLVYYRGSAGRGTKTDWMMHEFRLPPPPSSPDHDAANLQDAEIWTVCRIFKRSMSYTKGRAAAAAASASMIGGKRSHHQLQLQQQQQHYYCSYYSCSASASMAPPASIVERAHVANNNIPRHRHHHLQLAPSPSLSSSSAAVTVSTVTGGSLTAASGLSDMLSFRDGGSNSWDELGRIMEVSKFC